MIYTQDSLIRAGRTILRGLREDGIKIDQCSIFQQLVENLPPDVALGDVSAIVLALCDRSHQ